MSAINGKSRFPASLPIGAPMWLDPGDMAAVGNGNGINAALLTNSRIILPTAGRIIRILVSAIGANTANANINLVVGIGNANGVVVPADTFPRTGAFTLASAGQQLFAASPSLNALVAAPDVPLIFTPDNWDAVFPSGTNLTVRPITDGTGALAHLRCIAVFVPVDTLLNKPLGTAADPAFNPAVDIA